MKRSLAVLLHVFALSVQAKFGIDDETTLEKLKLPWGTYEASPYKGDEQVSVFKNVRFGQPPVRFGAPAYPVAVADNSTVQDSSYGPSCIQASVQDKLANAPRPPPGGEESEDCLFLDVYVPTWVLEPDAPLLPVVVYFHGGAYIFGSKDATFKDISFYDGQSVMDVSGGGLIWVVGNYRLGAYGFLAGDTMEKLGTPNAALHDQRLLLQWVRDYIGQVSGDKEAVTAWGHSAGAGSLLHHLTAYGGKQNPLFHQAVLLSPTYQWASDRSGALERTFKQLVRDTDCGAAQGGEFECLRKTSNKTLKDANQAIVDQTYKHGLLPFGPAVDGSWVPKLATTSLNQKETVNISSLIISHVKDEASLFVTGSVDTPSRFSSFLSLAFPGDRLKSVRKSIEDKYPSPGEPFNGNQTLRLQKMLQDWTFVCNTRQIYDAFPKQVYAMQYGFVPATHGSDVVPLSYTGNRDSMDLLEFVGLPENIASVLAGIVPSLSYTYLRYYVSHAIYGNPNDLRGNGMMEWPLTEDDGNQITNALQTNLIFLDPAHRFFDIRPDAESSRDNCQFWTETASAITKANSAGLSAAKNGLRMQDSHGTWEGLELK